MGLICETLEVEDIHKERKARSMPLNSLSQLLSGKNQAVLDGSGAGAEKEFVIKAEQNSRGHITPLLHGTSGMVFDKISSLWLRDQLTMHARSIFKYNHL